MGPLVPKRAFLWIGRRSTWVVAVLMLSLMFVPADAWQHPENDAEYEGFDRSLLYADRRGFLAETPADKDVRGSILITREKLNLTALPNSRPTVQLLTSPLDRFRVDMDVLPLKSSRSSETLEIGLWSPRNRAGVFLSFGPPSARSLVFTARRDGLAGQTLLGGDTVLSNDLGQYVMGLPHRVRMELDKDREEIVVEVTGPATPAGVGGVLRLQGGPKDPRYVDVASGQFPVVEGQLYRFGGLMKRVAGNDAHKVAIHWYSRKGTLVSITNDWRSGTGLFDWKEQNFTAIAPPGAVRAYMVLGAGNGTQMLFSNMFVSREGSDENLIPGGDFGSSTSEWRALSAQLRPLDVSIPQPFTRTARFDLDYLPELKNSLRVALTAWTGDGDGRTSVTLSNYRLTLPHQTWQVTETRDPKATLGVFLLFLLGALIILFRIRRWVSSSWRGALSPQRVISVPIRRVVLLIGVVGATVIVNVLLYQAGSLPFDMFAQRVWSHVATNEGLGELYHLPNTASLAAVWGGAPFHEAVFPYEPITGYLFWIVGWAHKIIFGEALSISAAISPIDSLLKAVNLLFALGNGYLAYRLVEGFGMKRRTAFFAATLIICNPAVWFSVSIWGQNHVVSTFFLLAALRLAQTEKPIPAWSCLVLSALTRPQMLVLGAFAAIFFFGRFSWRRNLEGLSLAVVTAFLLMTPFMISLGPSAPVDVLKNQLFVQEGGGNEPELTTVSLGAYSVWPGVTGVTESDSNLDRFAVPSRDVLFGDVTYQRLSMLLSVVLICGVGALLAVFRGEERVAFPIMAFGASAFLMVKTGLAPSHFLLALPLLVISRKWIPAVLHYLMVTTWSITTLIAMYGTVSSALTNVEQLGPLLHPTSNAFSRLITTIYASDTFISVAVASNVVVTLLVLGAGLVNVRKEWIKTRKPASYVSFRYQSP